MSNFDILAQTRAARTHQREALLAPIHARILTLWPDWQIKTLAAFKAKLARMRTPPPETKAARLTPITPNEIETGHTYLAVLKGDTTAVCKLFTIDNRPTSLAPFTLYRIDL